jgi:superfamily I DNA and/or RNA helicase
MQALERRQKVLVCAPSNIAVDTILMRLVDCLSDNKRDNKSKSQVTLANFRNQIVRLGHPARVSASILEFTLDSHIEHDEVRSHLIISDYLTPNFISGN